MCVTFKYWKELVSGEYFISTIKRYDIQNFAMFMPSISFRGFAGKRPHQTERKLFSLIFINKIKYCLTKGRSRFIFHVQKLVSILIFEQKILILSTSMCVCVEVLQFIWSALYELKVAKDRRFQNFMHNQKNKLSVWVSKKRMELLVHVSIHLMGFLFLFTYAYVAENSYFHAKYSAI